MDEPIGQFKAIKPMLSGPASLVEGYAALHQQEAKYTQIALCEMGEIAAVWYRSLTLLNRAIRREHDSGSAGPNDAWYAWDLRLRLLSTAGLSSKLCLDAALAGYYSQAYGLIRHMLETWRIMAYVRVVHQAARNWYPVEPGKRVVEPGETTIRRGIQQYGDDQLKRNEKTVAGMIKTCHGGAHATTLAATQVETGKPGYLQLGGNFLPELATSVMDLGTLATLLLLEETWRVIDVDRAWRDELAATIDARSCWASGR